MDLAVEPTELIKPGKEKYGLAQQGGRTGVVMTRRQTSASEKDGGVTPNRV